MSLDERTDERTAKARRNRLHRRVWDLLPWYANGTLAAAERRTVEEHLASCAPCRDEVGRCRGLGAAVGAAEEVAPSPHPVQLARLMARIEEAEAHPAGEDGAPRARFGALLAATPRAVRLLFAAQAAALLLLAAGLAWRQGAAPAPALFETLSTEPEAAVSSPAAATGARLRVLFADSATEREVRDVLAAVRGQIVGGPSPLGAFTVEIPTGPGVDPLPLVLAHLRSRPQVTFAEPVAGEAGSG